MITMDKLVSKIEKGEDYFGSGSYNSPEFNRFFLDFRRALKKELESFSDYTNSIHSKGHFYISGFFSINMKHYYYSISDVRHGLGQPNQVLVRTATSYHDYTGGHNRYVRLDHFADDFKKTFNL